MSEVNFEVRNQEAEKALKEVGEKVKKITPEGFGFAVMIFELGEKGSMFYISSARREDMIKALRELEQKLIQNK